MSKRPNGEGEFPKAGMTLDDKLDILTDALVDIRQKLDDLDGVAESVEELKQQAQEIKDTLDNLGFPGDGFTIDRYRDS